MTFNNPNICYVGSTNNLNARIKGHKNELLSKRMSKYKELTDLYDVQNCYFTIIKTVKYDTRAELRREEYKYIKLFPNAINTQLKTRDNKVQNNNEKIKCETCNIILNNRALARHNNSKAHKQKENEKLLTVQF